MIEFRFDSLASLLAMDGHGFYVWLCVLLAVIVVVGNIVALRASRKNFLLAAKARLARRQAKARAANPIDPSPSS